MCGGHILGMICVLPYFPIGIVGLYKGGGVEAPQFFWLYMDVYVLFTLSYHMFTIVLHCMTIPRYHLERYGRRAFSVAGPTLWNALPPAIRRANSVSVS